MNSVGIASNIFLLINFSCFEKRYMEKSLKSIAIENSFSKIFVFNNFYKNRKRYTNMSNLETFFKYRANLLASSGDKISFQLHLYFLFSFIKNKDKNLITMISLINYSRKYPIIDLKLFSNCLKKILINSSNKNLYFKEEFELLKSEYFFQTRSINHSFCILSKIFIFSGSKTGVPFYTNFIVKMIDFLKMLMNRLNFFNTKKTIIKENIMGEQFDLNNISTLKTCDFECQDFCMEKLQNFIKMQTNWRQNRHYIKKIFRKKYYTNILSSFDKIDFLSLKNNQKICLQNSPLSFDIFVLKNIEFFFPKIIANESLANIDLSLYNSNII